MHTNKQYLPGWMSAAALLGLIAVGIDAIAAHAVAEPRTAAALEKAALYQLIHAVVLLFASQLTGRLAQLSRWLMLIGIILFCGSIELKYLFDVQDATIVAPSGGISLMLGWVILGVAAFWQNRAEGS